MPPLSDAERQKLLLQQEIAKLSGAISRAATTNTHQTSYQTSYHPYRGTYPPRGGYTSRGRGRGRGGSYGIDNRPARLVAVPSVAATSSSSAPASARPSRAPATPEIEEGEVSEPAVSSTTRTAAPAGPNQDWVKKMSKRGNMSLMTVQKSNKLAARPPPPRRHPKVPPQIQQLESTSDASGDSEAKRVVIDGVIFQFEQGGQKLVRIGELPSTTAGSAGTRTRQSLDYGGESYRRTKRGNLISRSRRAEQAKKPCRYYTKTGRCDRALTCPYKHDPSRLAICHKFLRGTCPNTAESCALSHSPSAHNTPSCVHFQTTASCRNGDACLYPHVRVADDAPVCEAFAREGWCDKPAGTCPELHIWECPEYRAKGTCARGARCGLRHVLRAEASKEKGMIAEAKAGAAASTAATAQDSVTNGFEDQAEFIGLPGEVFSSEEDDDDEEDEGEDEEDEENEGDDEDDEEDDEDEEGSAEEENGEEEDDDDDEAGGEGDVSMADVSMAVSHDSGKPSSASPLPDMDEDDDEDDEARVLDEV